MGDQKALKQLRHALAEDLRVNKGHPKEQLVLLSLRSSQLLTEFWKPLGRLATIIHRLLTEVVYGLELRPETRIGAGLRLFHGYATVVHTGTVIGENVTLHQSITIGLRKRGGGAPIIRDGVSIGAGAIILGDIVVGKNAKIGAGAVVLKDVPPGAVAVGNPARVILT